MKKKKEIEMKSISVIMTPEYLYKEGIKFYQEAVGNECAQDSKKDFDDVKEIYLKAILYLQASMLLGSDDACAYLSEFYSKDNHLGINDRNISNLIKTISVVTKFTSHVNKTKSVFLRDFGITIDSDLEELTFIEKGMIESRRRDWDKIPVPKYLVEPNVLSIIQSFNTKVLSQYKLITDISVFECNEIIEEFTMLEDTSGKLVSTTTHTTEIKSNNQIFDFESRSMKPNDNSMDHSLELLALGCTIS